MFNQTSHPIKRNNFNEERQKVKHSQQKNEQKRIKEITELCGWKKKSFVICRIFILMLLFQMIVRERWFSLECMCFNVHVKVYIRLGFCAELWLQMNTFILFKWNPFIIVYVIGNTQAPTFSRQLMLFTLPLGMELCTIPNKLIRSYLSSKLFPDIVKSALFNSWNEEYYGIICC